jgi:hypothetical protein
MTAAQRQKAYRDRKRNAERNGDDRNASTVTRYPEDDDLELPWPVNRDKPPRWGPGVPVYIAPTEVEKAAMVKREELQSRRLREERKVAA